MKQTTFERLFDTRWEEFANSIDTLQGQGSTSVEQKRVIAAQFSQEYRKVCNDLALAKSRRYSPHLIDRLNDLAIRGHQVLYHSKRRPLLQSLLQFIITDFPRAFIREKKWMLMSFALLYIPAIIFGTLIYWYPELAYSFFSAEQLRNFDSMYNPMTSAAERYNRSSGDNLVMFGYYIRHNISIGLQTFASGMLFGVGTIYYLIYNALALGGIAGYLTQLGYIDTFWGFVIGHGAFELTAIGIAGASGLKIGFALIAPGQRTRKDALVATAKECLPLIYGTIFFLVIAAFIEGFWSPLANINSLTKYIVGGLLWLIVVLYFARFARFSQRKLSRHDQVHAHGH